MDKLILDKLILLIFNFGLFVFVTRIIQVVVQAVFILLARRLRALSPSAMETKPGKQFVTFLLIANVALFFFHTVSSIHQHI